MSSVYMYVNFRITRTVSLNIKLFCNDSLKTSSFIVWPCLFIPLQEKSTVTGIRVIVEILFTIKAGEEKKTTFCPHTNSQLDVQCISKVGWNSFCYMYFVLPFSVRSQCLLFSKNET